MTDTEIKYSLQEISQEETWNKALLQFKDANIYQSWNFSRYAQNEKIIQHLAFYKNAELIGLAAVRVRKAPLVKRGIVYILNGPIWQKKNINTPETVLYKILDLLKHEFVIKHKFLLRIKPYVFSDINPQIHSFEKQGFKKIQRIPVYKSLVLYLDNDIDQIRQSFRPRWRNHLNQAEKNKLKIVSGSDSELYEIFIQLYEQMHEIKKFKEFVSVKGMYKVNKNLSNEFKLQIFIAFKDDKPVSGLVGTTIGNTSIYLLGASNKKGREVNSSYLLQWEMIKWSKIMNCCRYDLGGINRVINPGVYQFKKGISKQEIFGIGTFETYNSKITKLIVNLGEFIQRVNFP
jgi:lipid II:glycine glycyltransferase (peptidoglycan interpeptide bridge formation enzyme)